MRRRTRSAGWIAWLLTIGALGSASRAAASDTKALEVADQVMTALGGESEWKATHFLRFDFAVDRDGKTLVTRAHTWDKWTGRYRLETKNKEGARILVLMNLNTQQGSAFKDGVRLQGEDEKQAVKNAYATWVNDTYWLLMPYKLKDPGVTLTYQGAKVENGKGYDVLFLTFGDVGLTPKDTYWVYVNQATHLVDRWEYVLQGQKPPATAFLWTGWQKHGNIMLAPERAAMKDRTRIYFPVLEVPAAVRDEAFTSGN